MAVIAGDLAGSFIRPGTVWGAAPESKSPVPLIKAGTAATGIVCGCGCDDAKQAQ